MKNFARIIFVSFISFIFITQIAYAIPTRLDFTATLTTGTAISTTIPNFTGYVLYDSAELPTSFTDSGLYFNLHPTSATYQGYFFSIVGLIGTTQYSFSSDFCPIYIKNDVPYFGSTLGLDEMVVNGIDKYSNTNMVMHFNELGHPANLFSDASLPTSLNIDSYVSDTDSFCDIVIGTLRGNIDSLQVSELAAVPEPSTLILLFAGIGGLSLWRKRTICKVY